MFSLIAAAFAAAPTDADVQALASKAVGKEVPSKYLCIERPSLPDAVSGDPMPVGIKVKNKGCVLRGVVIDGKWLEPNKALIVAVPGWSALKADARGEIGVPWVRDVLLAYEQVIGAPAWTGDRVTAELVRRIPHPQHAEQGTGTFKFSNAGEVERSLADTQVYKTGMAVKMNGVKGITAADATAGLSTTGKLFKECVRAAWAQDLTSEGRTRLGWDIVEGKATKVTGRGYGATPLLRCYSGALQRGTFAADGHVDATVAITRIPVAKP